jgi:hypothetical protein
MARRARDADADDLPIAFTVTSPNRWELEPIVSETQAVLDAVEAPPIDQEARLVLQRLLYRGEYLVPSLDPQRFPPTGRAQTTLLLRTILASEGNGGDALVAPIISAVHGCMRPEWTDRDLAWIAAFDNIKLVELLRAMRELDFCPEREISNHLALAIQRRLARTFAPPPESERPKPSKKELREAAAARQAAANERRINLGKQLLDLRARAENRRDFSRQRNQIGVDSTTGSYLTAVARLYSDRPEIFGATRWSTLCAMASPSLPAAAREMFERRIMAGERLGLSDVRRACGKRQSGRPKRAMAVL